MSPQSLPDLPRPLRLLEAVRAVFEHAGFEVTTPFNRPKLVDFIVQWPASSEPLAVACLSQDASENPSVISEIVASAQSRGYAKVQIICDVPCSPSLHQAAAEAQAELVDGPGFEAALATLPEDARAQFATYPKPTPAPARKTPPPLPLSYLISQPTPAPPSTAPWVVAAGIVGAVAVVTLVLLGFTAAIAIPKIGRINAAAEESAARRDAQQLASVAAAARATDQNLQTSPDLSVEGAIEAVAAGATITNQESSF